MSTKDSLKKDPLKNIFLVDDEAEIRETLKELLEQQYQDISIIEAKNGNEALLKAESQKFDLIITDICMPVLKGTSFLKHLFRQKNGKLPDHILVLSGFLDKEAEVANNLKNVTFMSKPFNEEQLFEYIDNNVKLSRKKSKRQKVGGNVEFINPFIDATLEVLDNTCSISASKVGVFVRQEEELRADISAVVAMSSSIFQGSMGICFEKSAFLHVYNAVSKKDVTTIEKDHSNVMAQLCTSIFEKSNSKLMERGIKIMPANPTVVSRDGHQVKYPIPGPCLSVEFSTGQGKFWVEAIVKTSKN